MENVAAQHSNLKCFPSQAAVPRPSDRRLPPQIVKKLLGQGVSASCCDYDKRSPLMVSAQEGKEVCARRGARREGQESGPGEGLLPLMRGGNAQEERGSEHSPLMVPRWGQPPPQE